MREIWWEKGDEVEEGKRAENEEKFHLAFHNGLAFSKLFENFSCIHHNNNQSDDFHQSAEVVFFFKNWSAHGKMEIKSCGGMWLRWEHIESV